jgi:hypothetical protein
MTAAGLCGYFCVDRHRRNLAIRQKVSALFLPFVCFKIQFLISNLFYIDLFDKTAFD